MDIGERIRTRRQQLRLSQAALGERSGLSNDTISRLELGTTKATLDHLEAIAPALACTHIQLIDPEWTMPPPHETYGEAV